MKQKIVKFMKCEIIVWNCKDLFIQESEPLFLGASVESAKLKKKLSCLALSNEILIF